MFRRPGSTETGAAPDVALVALNGIALSLSLSMAILALVLNTLWTVAEDLTTDPGRRPSLGAAYLKSVILRYVLPLAAAALVGGIGSIQASRRGKAVRWATAACAVVSTLTLVLTLRQIWL